MSTVLEVWLFSARQLQCAAKNATKFSNEHHVKVDVAAVRTFRIVVLWRGRRLQASVARAPNEQHIGQSLMAMSQCHKFYE